MAQKPISSAIRDFVGSVLDVRATGEQQAPLHQVSHAAMEPLGVLTGTLHEEVPTWDVWLRERTAAVADYDSASDYLQWKYQTRTPILEPNEHSRLHTMIEAYLADAIYYRWPGESVEVGVALTSAERHPFVVKHDWARALANASGMGDEFRLPYDTCVFEFRVSGKSVNVLASNDGGANWLLPLVQVAHGVWVCVAGEDDCERELTRFLRGQIRAICYALESGVAAHSVVRQPAKFKAKRERNGKLPVYDYHVVDLARRERARSTSSSKEYLGCVRLHFRRGHWRQMEAKATWVKACLVGNPDLGWVEKEYRL